MATKAYDKLSAAVNGMLSLDAAIRPRDSANRPGGLIDFPDSDTREVIIAGDLHANNENLKKILRHRHTYTSIKEGRTVLLLLGDAFHESREDMFAEMDTSLHMLDLLVRLISEAPTSVFYLRGNHDSFSAAYTKGGVQQGHLFGKHITHRRGSEYEALVSRFFDTLPYMVRHPRFLALHAGPPQGGTTRDAVVNIKDDAALSHALIWNRINDLKLPPHDGLYGNADLEALRRGLAVPERTPVIVGHNPMRHRGSEGLWIDLANCHDHVIFTSDTPGSAAYLRFCDAPSYEIHRV